MSGFLEKNQTQNRPPVRSKPSPVSLFLRCPVLQSGFTLRGDRLYPFSAEKVSLHQHIPDWLVDVTTGKYKQNVQVPDHARDPDGGHNDGPHKQDFKNRAESGITCCPEGVVLGPVPHTDEGRDGIDAEHAEGDRKALAAHSHGGQDRSVQRDEGQAQEADKSLTQVNKTPSSPVGGIDSSGSRFGSDKNGSGI